MIGHQYCRKVQNFKHFNSVVGKILTFLGWSQVCGGGAAAPARPRESWVQLEEWQNFKHFKLN